MSTHFVRKLESLGPLDDEAKALIAGLNLKERTIEHERDLISEGEKPNFVHLVASGLAFRYKILADGQRQIVAFMLPGDICDLHGFVLHQMDHCIGTKGLTSIIDIPRNIIDDMFVNASLGRVLLKTVLVDQATLREWITNVGRRRAEERIAHLICELYIRMKAVGLADGGEFAFPFTQTELSDTVGLSVVHVNRSLKDLRERGLVTFRSGKFCIHDAQRLEKMSGFRSNYLHLNN